MMISLIQCLLLYNRNPYSTILSMLEHKGVSNHFKRSRKFNHPNVFLGTNLMCHKAYLSLNGTERAC